MGSDKILTEAELIETTGAKQVAKQKEVLRNNGINYIERKDGSIIVLWYYLEHPVLTHTEKSIAANDTPDFQAIING